MRVIVYTCLYMYVYMCVYVHMCVYMEEGVRRRRKVGVPNDIEAQKLAILPTPQSKLN